MKKYLHIGYPKNFSTSLQRNYFGGHKDIYHLGIGSDKNIGYIDNLTASIFEVYLKTAKYFKYTNELPRLKKHINSHFEIAKKQEKKCFGVSSEHISFGFTHESLDFKTKIDRAIDIFGKEDLNIIIIIRNQSDLIKSLYRESVRVGLPGSYSDFIYNLYKFQDRNYLFDFRYDLVFNYLEKTLDRKNIHFFMFEEYRGIDKSMKMNGDKVALIDDISKALGIEYKNIEFEHFNEALSDREIIIKSELNSETRHDLGREMNFSAEIHRQAEYFNSELNINEEEKIIYEDVIRKRGLISKVKNDTTTITEDKLSYDCDPSIKEWLAKFFVKGNQSLEENLNIKLPNSYHELKF
jgi:hypothetical protein